MIENEKDAPNSGQSARPPEFLNYFGKDRPFQLWFARKRTELASAVFPFFARCRLVPDTISYCGIALLMGVVLFFVRDPGLAVLFLAGHIICDGLDGAYARHSNTASQSGAFTDLVCDQFGMVVVAVLAVFHHLVHPIIGTLYISLYLIVVVFGVLINVMGLGVRVTVTSKYFLYIVYSLWTFCGVNFFSHLMSFFSAIMSFEVIVGYLRLKSGIRRKFDAEVRFADGDPYSGRLNYALNVAAPVTIFLIIVIASNMVPIRAVLDGPTLDVKWIRGETVPTGDETGTIIGIGGYGEHLLILARCPDDRIEVRKLSGRAAETVGRFVMPGYIVPAFGAVPVNDGILMPADTNTRLLFGIDLEDSFAAGRPVIVFTLPLGHVRITAMAVTKHKGKTVWLTANYLYTRKTYLIDPERASRTGELTGGFDGCYVNGAFPAGLAAWKESVIEFNRTPANGLLYVAPLDRLLKGTNLLRGKTASFAPPVPDALGPVIQGEDLVMISPEGLLFRLPLKETE
ncbi:MAG: CDP-alcohol phosphatidyltransferase family protein [Pseudomonadota bacterium]